MTELQKIELAKIKIFSYVVGDIIKTIRGGALMGAFVQCFCLIDYLAAIGREANNDKISDNYEKFIENHLNYYDPKKLYAVRCGLIHTYGPSNSMKDADLDGYAFQHKNPRIHNKYYERIYYLNLSNFLFDIIKTTYDFFNKIEKVPERDLSEYCRRMEVVLVVFNPFGIVANLNFGSIDPVLSCMDCENINWSILENEIYKLCLTK